MAASKGVDVAEVIALYQAGRSLNQIAEKHGVNPHTVYYHLRRQGVPAASLCGVHGLWRMPTTSGLEQLRAQGLAWAEVPSRSEWSRRWGEAHGSTGKKASKAVRR